MIVSDKKMLGLRITQAREAKGITMADLARRIPGTKGRPITRSSIKQWETGATEPSAMNLRRVADILDVSLEWLANGLGGGSPEVINSVDGRSQMMSEGELVDLKKLAPDQAKLLAAAMSGKKAEVWRVISCDAMAGLGYRPGDYLIVDVGVTPKAGDRVLAEINKNPVFRVLLPPFLYQASLTSQPAPLDIHKDRTTVIRGVVASRLSLP